MKVFLSYSRDDAGTIVAPAIGKMLADHGFEVWDPGVEILPGDNGPKVMGQALDQSDAMIILLTDNYLGSSWSAQDLSFALGNERYRDRVIAVTVEGEGGGDSTAGFPTRLPRVKWDRRNPSKAIEEIEHQLKSAA